VALEWVWEICGRVCSRRLQPFLPELLTMLERCQELVLPAHVKSLRLDMSRATIHRGLGPARFDVHPGLSTCPPVPGEDKDQKHPEANASGCFS
jgi:hypothetical protein